MGKQLLTDVKVVIISAGGTADLSHHADSVDTPSEKEQVDVSGFNAAGTREFLPGLADQTITVQFLQDFGSGSVHSVLYPLYTGGSAFTVYVQPDSDAGTSDTNPVYGGTANLYSYNGLNGSLNDPSKTEAIFKPANGASFTWGTAAP